MAIRRWCVVLWIAIPAPALVCAQNFDWKNPPQGVFVDDWMIVEFGGGKIGHAHNTMTREGDRIVSRVLTVMSFGRADAQLKISMMESSTESLDGKPLKFETITDMGQMQIIHRGTVHDGKVQLASTQAGQEVKQTFDYPDGAIMSWGLYRKQFEMGFMEGTTYDVLAYLPSQKPDGAVEGKVTVLGREKIDVDGESKEAIKIMQTLRMPPFGELNMVGWMDDEGSTLVAEIPMPGMGSLRMVRADKETALKLAEPPEFFMQTLVKADREIDRKTARKIRYRLSLKDPTTPFPPLPATGMQTPGAVSGNVVELTVARQDHAALANGAATPPTADLEEYLESNSMMNLGDPELVAMAKKAASGETHPYKLADKLRRYVTDVISSKNLNVGFGTATEVCRSKEGDCSEHGVLLAALGRINGLPSRVVTGLVYVPAFKEADRVFGFHMWTQFHINDQWVDFDAAQHETDCNPTHIAVNVSSMKGGSMIDAAFALMSMLGQLQIEILDVT